MTGRWDVHYKDIKHEIKKGSFKLKIYGVSLTIGITLGEDSTGRPTITATSCSGDVGKVDIKFDHSISWLLNLFRDSIESSMKEQIKKKLCSYANEAVNKDAQQALAKVKLETNLGKVGLLDYSLVTPPVFGNGYIETSHKGEVYWISGKQEAPFTPAPFPALQNNTKMAYFFISDYLVNSAAWQMQNHGLIIHNLTKSDFDLDQKYRLNTTCSGSFTKACIGNFIVKLQDFVNSSVEIVMYTTEAPKLIIEPEGVLGHFIGRMNFTLLMPNGTRRYIFAVTVDAKVNMTIGMNGGNVTGNVTHITPRIGLVDTKIGPIANASLQIAFQMLSNNFIKKAMNKIANVGLPLPQSDELQFVHTEINQVADALLVGTDLNWNPNLRVLRQKRFRKLKKWRIFTQTNEI